MSTTTPKDWQKQLDFDMEFATSQLIEFGDVRPVFAIRTRDNGLLLMPASWPDADAKMRMLTIVRLAAAAYDAVAITAISEAWMRSVERRHGETGAEFETRSRATRPSQAEDRIEVIIAVLTYNDPEGERHTISATSEILRDAEGKPTGVRLLPTSQDETTGTFTDLLPAHDVPPELRQAARAALDKAGVTMEPATTHTTH